ncbi:FecR family protein [Rhodocytophaga rosea]|uniref:FecR family protein n=1 Tax=Rhodocytophaga rosea TaxID=2704465 RepID=A0A6C0GHP9_9BACT|nr:FecR domain-containing protein [Rhodocytophaga rosea]QHT67479.1 FecR family protein [Rhodocytophaga rosea]
MEQRHLVKLIKKWVAGKASPDERIQLEEKWNNALQDESYLQSLPEQEREDLRTTSFQNVWKGIYAQEKNRQPARKPAKKVPLYARRTFWMAAASLVLLLAIGIPALYKFYYESAWLTISTPAGKRRQIKLPDQSLVIINGNSSVRFAKEWDQAQIREVWLKGEAYFSVQHTASHQKFIVHTSDGLKVEVLGTKFNVFNRQGDTRIVLQEGKVKVSDPTKDYVMKPGEAVSYSAQMHTITPEIVQVQPIVSWKDKIRLYRDVSIQDIFKELQESHGIRVEYKNQSIKHEVFNGSVPNDSIELLFDKIEKLYAVNVTKLNGVYIIE